MESIFNPYIKNQKLITHAHEHLNIFLVLMEERTDRIKTLLRREILLQEKSSVVGKDQKLLPPTLRDWLDWELTWDTLQG